MLRHRFAAAALSLSLLSLAACGEEADKGLDNVDITAEAGKAPEVKWQGKLEPTEVETEVLVEGDGDETKEGDTVRVHYWFGNGFTEEEAESSYEQSDPLALELNKELTPALKAAFIGHPMGSVVAVASPAEEAFGEQGNPGLGFGEGDSVLIIAELVEAVPADEVAAMKKQQEDQAKAQEKAAADLEKAKKNALKSAKGAKVDPAAWAPQVTFKDGEVPVLDFKGTPKPNGKLQVTKLIDGKGKKVKAGQTLIAHYVGQVHQGDEPFDSSYSGGEAASFPIGVGQVIQGWDQALVGQRIGSRVIVQIPPELGYGEAGQPDAGIEGTDTLVFVVDILGAA
ncbi:FKBP-type peptidyl-prolyl cis-trans isomerase [Nocardioides gilvus]|uniref:FKBP-type peptidyl-prolyl cis-trans isomerase n=1 Tax=Nocardioides gilvus TaxID=1735589 RepID=UPI0013A5ADCA|nr:FKBP-type peptidyl-prolyl cis-trans isomerase [Nocardioides gilvus]